MKLKFLPLVLLLLSLSALYSCQQFAIESNSYIQVINEDNVQYEAIIYSVTNPMVFPKQCDTIRKTLIKTDKYKATKIVNRDYHTKYLRFKFVIDSDSITTDDIYISGDFDHRFIIQDGKTITTESLHHDDGVIGSITID